MFPLVASRYRLALPRSVTLVADGYPISIGYLYMSVDRLDGIGLRNPISIGYLYMSVDRLDGIGLWNPMTIGCL